MAAEKIHPTLEPLRPIGPNRVSSFISNNFDDYPYSYLLADMIAQFGDRNTIRGVVWKQGQQVAGFSGGITDLAGEVGMLAQVKDEGTTPHYMQLRLYSPENSSYSSLKHSNLKWQRRGSLRIRTGELSKLLANGSYLNDYSQDVAEFDGTDQVNQDNVRGGTGYRSEVQLAVITGAKDLSRVGAVFTNPWLAEAVLRFDRERARLDQRFNTPQKVKDQRGTDPMINLKGTAILF